MRLSQSQQTLIRPIFENKSNNSLCSTVEGMFLMYIASSVRELSPTVDPAIDSVSLSSSESLATAKEVGIRYMMY